MHAERFAAGLALAVVLDVGATRALELELPFHGGIVMPTESDSSLASAGPIGGLTPLLRLNQPIAVGALFEHSRLTWRARGAPGDVLPGSALLGVDRRGRPDRRGGRFFFFTVGTTGPVRSSVPVCAGTGLRRQRLRG